MDISKAIIDNIFWVDVVAFGLLFLMLLLLWISNHIFLQFFTALLLINIGGFTLALPFLSPYIFSIRDFLLAKIDAPALKAIIMNFAKNPLFIEIIFFAVVFFVCFLFAGALYLAFIKFKYYVPFSILSLRLNFWKLIYIPFFFLGIGYIAALIVPVVGSEIAQKSYFLKIIYATKANKLIERKNYIPAANVLFQSLDELGDEKVPLAKKKKTIVKLLSLVLPSLVDEKTKNKIKSKLKAPEKKIVDDLLVDNLNEQQLEARSDRLLKEITKRKEIDEKIDEVLTNKKFIDEFKKIKQTPQFKNKSLTGIIEDLSKRIDRDKIQEITGDRLNDFVDNFEGFSLTNER